MRKIDMRDFIQAELDRWNLGKLDTVVGPKRDGEYDPWKIHVKYIPEGVTDHFDYGSIWINIGYKREGGYWNRVWIRKAIAEEGRKALEGRRSEVVWKRAQLAITDGRDSGSFAL
jgi:hypothetical protein